MMGGFVGEGWGLCRGGCCEVCRGGGVCRGCGLCVCREMDRWMIEMVETL